MADSTGQGSGFSRRRVLMGATWSAPAIVIATSVPARAASLDEGEGITIITLESMYEDSHWNQTAGVSQPAFLVQTNLQNAPNAALDPTPVIALQLTFTVPVGNITNPAWGLGEFGPSSTEGVEETAPWVLASPVVVTAGVATLRFSYTGTAIPQFSAIQPGVWVQVASSQVGQTANLVALATHANGNISSDAASDAAVLAADDPPGGL